VAAGCIFTAHGRLHADDAAGAEGDEVGGRVAGDGVVSLGAGHAGALIGGRGAQADEGVIQGGVDDGDFEAVTPVAADFEEVGILKVEAGVAALDADALGGGRAYAEVVVGDL